MSNNYLTLSSQETTVICDPVFSEHDPLAAHDYVILTHLDNDALDFLADYDEQKNVYVSFEFYKLIQKLIAVKLLAETQVQLKIIPYQYPLTLGDIRLTAFPNDDGQFGSFALLATGPEKTVGYCDAVYTHGNHNKRIKRWKKIFQQSQLDILVLGSKISPLTKNQNALSENGMQEMLTKFITKNNANAPLTALLSPFNPERLYRYDKTAKLNQTPIIWNKNYLQLLQAFYPYAEFYGAENLPLTSKSALVQSEQRHQLAANKIFTDPAVLHPEAISITGLIYQKQLCALSQSELHDFTEYLAADQVIMKEDRSLNQNHLIPQKWLQSLALTI
ncbi:hypothetical protein LPAF129_00560 [Ligilactobacillus pabuli]|uniref:Uncharacterized protein n=1 Tax=Ligilactobacillus pabuli TaxID=2886039 RepID=A0ABQ5JEV0_9LACO|nr:hypothetical protein [Ligilactobacillus pabuli]GKS80371.1 hypothetical protein LPAF129_00560 [Ligilactobacillus pabuli]